MKRAPISHLLRSVMDCFRPSQRFVGETWLDSFADAKAVIRCWRIEPYRTDDELARLRNKEGF